MLNILREGITDNRFLRLIQNILQAGYLEEWRYTPTLSGTPQGGTVSPILANIYMNRLDRFVEQALIPEHTKGKKRAKNAIYNQTSSRAHYCRLTGRVGEAKRLEQARRAIPANDPHDPDYRRLYYVRYADDFLMGFVVRPRIRTSA